MPLDRSELIARSLLHANAITGGNLTLPAMIDNQQFQQLPPEERAKVVEQYAMLSNHQQQYHNTPSIMSTIGSGAKNGLLTAALPTILAGVITVPTLAAVTASMGQRVPMMNLIKRTAAPLALAGGIGIAAGIAGSLLGRAHSADNNKYIGHLVNSIRDEPDDQTRQIKAMSILAAAPTLNRRTQATENMGANITSGLIGNYLAPNDRTKSMFTGILPRTIVALPNGATTQFNYNNWNYVEGHEGMIDDLSGSPTHKIVPIGAP